MDLSLEEVLERRKRSSQKFWLVSIFLVTPAIISFCFLVLGSGAWALLAIPGYFLFGAGVSDKIEAKTILEESKKLSKAEQRQLVKILASEARQQEQNAATHGSEKTTENKKALLTSGQKFAAKTAASAYVGYKAGKHIAKW